MSLPKRDVALDVYELLALLYAVVTWAEGKLLRFRNWVQKAKMRRIKGSNPGRGW